jgi:hypothetical protein
VGECFGDRAPDAAGRASDQNRSTAHAIMLAGRARCPPTRDPRRVTPGRLGECGPPIGHLG